GVAGAAILDLHEEIDIDAVRMVGPLDAFRAGEMSFEVVVSNDNFAGDARSIPVPRPRFETHYAEMLLYMYTYQFPAYVLPVRQRARYLKITARRDDDT